MSFNRTNYDICSVEQSLEQSMKPGQYRLNPPTKSVSECFLVDPNIRLQKTGNSVNKNKPLVDVDSELLGITRKNSKCASQKMKPCKTNEVNFGLECVKENLTHRKNCGNKAVEHCRLTNPPCTLRGTGWERWDWLPKNPQENVSVPFKWNSDSRLEAKDQHRPCVPTPMDQSASLPGQHLEMHLHHTL